MASDAADGGAMLAANYQAEARRHSLYAFMAALVFFIAFSGALLTRELAVRDEVQETNRRLDRAIEEAGQLDRQVIERLTVLECRAGIRTDC